MDATSFVAMRRLGLREALAFDRHFTIAGFALISDQGQEAASVRSWLAEIDM